MQRLSWQPAQPSQGSPSSSRQPLRLNPKSVGELLDQSLEIFKKRFFACVLTAFFIWLPSQVLATTYLSASEGNSTQTLIGLAVEIGLGTLISGAVAQVSYATLRGQDLAVSVGLKRVLRALPRMLSVLILLGVLMGILWLPVAFAGASFGPVGAFVGTAFALPWTLFLVWRVVLAQVVVVLEYVTPPRAMSRSYQLTKGCLGRWLALFLVATCLTLPLQWGAASFSNGSAQAWLLRQLPMLGDAGVEVLTWLLGSAFLSVPAAFSAVTLTVLYVDQRVRLEGFDLLLRLEQRTSLAARAQPRSTVSGELA